MGKLEILKQLHTLKPILKEEFAVKSVGLFGSFAKGRGRPSSDIDLLVEFSQPIGLFRFLELEDFLSRRLGHRVDLVSRKSLKPIIGTYILKHLITA